jgi:hypothetical protein
MDGSDGSGLVQQFKSEICRTQTAKYYAITTSLHAYLTYSTCYARFIQPITIGGIVNAIYVADGMWSQSIAYLLSYHLMLTTPDALDGSFLCEDTHQQRSRCNQQERAHAASNS